MYWLSGIFLKEKQRIEIYLQIGLLESFLEAEEMERWFGRWYGEDLGW